MKQKTIQPVNLHFTLNGKAVVLQVKPATLLLEVIRDHLGLTGTKAGCHEGECGACTVLVDDKPVNSCLFLAVNANGCQVTTVEGLISKDGVLDAVQQSLVDNGAVQCGFCTSGMAMSLKALVNHYENSQQVPGDKHNDIPAKEEIQKWLEGNLCRCTGYVKIIDAAEKLFKKEA